MKVSDEKFIEVWQTAQSQIEVEQRLQMDRKAVKRRAETMRERNVPLKSLQSGGRRRDWAALADLARSYLQQGERAETSDSEILYHDK